MAFSGNEFKGEFWHPVGWVIARRYHNWKPVFDKIIELWKERKAEAGKSQNAPAPSWIITKAPMPRPWYEAIPKLPERYKHELMKAKFYRKSRMDAEWSPIYAVKWGTR